MGMKTKTKANIKKISAALLLKITVYATLGGVFAGGRLATAAHPFALALVSALHGFVPCLSAAAGAVIGSARLSSGGVHAALILGVFAVRLLLGKWLSAPSSLTEQPAETDGAALLERVLGKARRFLTEAARLGFSESIFIRMTTAVAGTMVYGAARCAAGGYQTHDLVGAVIASVASPFLVYLYAASSERDARGTHEVLSEAGRCALAASFVMSLNGITPYFDAAVPAAFIITLLVTRDGGVFLGVVYGVLCGVVLTPALAPMYALAALTAGVLWKFSPAVAVTGACTVGCIWSIYSTGFSAMNSVVPELIITSAITAPIVSSSLMPSPRGRTRIQTGNAGDDTSAVMLRRETSRKMKSLSDSMSELSGVLYRLSDRLTSPETEELCELCEAAFEESCSACGMRSACFGREGEQTAALQARMTLSLKNDGRVSAAVVPPSMAKRCYSMGQIIDRMNAGCAKLISEAKLYDRTSVVAADYEVMSEMLKESSEYDSGEYELDRALTARVRAGVHGVFKADSIGVFGNRVKKVIARGVNVKGGTPGADDIKELFSTACGFDLSDPEFELNGSQVIMKLSSLPRFSVRCGRASVAMSELGTASMGKPHGVHSATKIFSPNAERRGLGKTSSEVCGDVISAFLTEDGRFFMLISDGMGSGKEAAMTSGVCAVFIEKLLKAGASMDTSLKMLNSMMRVRGNEVSATVDLMELDLMNGRTRFVKSGAAPSFVLRGGRPFRLQSKTVPIGIVRALDAEMIKFETEPGDIIVMLSDGVVRSFEDCPWLYDMLCDEKEWTADPERMARKIIKHAIKNGAEDDITAGIVMVDG